MKTFHLLLLAAACVTPLQASTPQENISALLSTQATRLSTARERAAINPSLSHIAAGLDFISLCNMSEWDSTILAGPDGQPLLPIRSLSIAVDGATLATQAATIQGLEGSRHLDKILRDWSREANETYAPALAEMAKEARRSNDSDQAIQAYIEQCPMSPVYISIELNPEIKMMAPMYLAQLPALMKNAPEGVKYSVKGTKIDVNFPAKLVMEGQDIKLPPPAVEALGERIIHVQLDLKGNFVNIAIGTDPESFKWAASTDESVLACNATNFMDTKLDGQSRLAASMSAKTINTMLKGSPNALAKPISKIFQALAPVDEKNLNIFNDAAAAVEKLIAGIDQMGPTMEQDISLLVWQDKGYHAEIKCPMIGQYVPSKMSAINTINDKSIAMMQSSGFVMNCPSMPAIQALLPDAMKVSNAVKLTMKPENMAEVMPVLNLVQSLTVSDNQAPNPMADMLMSTIKSYEPSTMKMLTSLGTSYGLSYAQGATPESAESVVAFAELKNKKQFTEGVTEFYQISNSIASSFGFPLPPCAPTLTEKGPISSYSFNECGLSLQADLSDQCLSISNDTAANAAMQSAIATGSGPNIPGAVFYVDFANAAPYVKELCDKKDYEGYKAFTEPFSSLIIIMQNDNPTSNKGSIKISLPLK